MHELSIAHSILSIAERAVPAGSKVAVTAVSLQIGELSSIEIESLEFAFSAIRSGTLLEKLNLILRSFREKQPARTVVQFFIWIPLGPVVPTAKAFW